MPGQIVLASAKIAQLGGTKTEGQQQSAHFALQEGIALKSVQQLLNTAQIALGELSILSLGAQV
jgi:hypothetical protein